MTIIEPGSAASGIIGRAKNLILQPSQEFERIDQETPSVASLYTGYAIPLAGAACLASAIGQMVFGIGAVFVHYRPSPITALSGAIIAFVFMLAGTWLLSKIIDFLAPNFGGQKNEIKATQTAVYSATAGWLAGLFAIFPPLMVLGLLGFYSIYLLYRGLPRLMKAPAQQAGMYAAAIIVSAFVIGVVFFSVAGAVTKALPFGGASPFAKHADPNATISVPGLGEIKTGDVKNLEAMAKSMEARKGIPAFPTETLKGLLPETLPGGFTRTAMSAGSGGAMGFSGATAEGVYSSGDRAIQLKVVDMAGAGALMGMASMFGVEASQETETTYSKTGKVDGRMTIEEADKTAKTASYTVVISDRVALSAEGQNVTSDDVKRAISAIGIPRVEALVKNAPKG